MTGDPGLRPPWYNLPAPDASYHRAGPHTLCALNPDYRRWLRQQRRRRVLAWLRSLPQRVFHVLRRFHDLLG